jgi:hypothetical protein
MHRRMVPWTQVARCRSWEASLHSYRLRQRLEIGVTMRATGSITDVYIHHKRPHHSYLCSVDASSK